MSVKVFEEPFLSKFSKKQETDLSRHIFSGMYVMVIKTIDVRSVWDSVQFFSIQNGFLQSEAR